MATGIRHRPLGMPSTKHGVRESDNRRAGFILLGAMLMISLVAAGMKEVGDRIHPAMLSYASMVTGLAFCLPYARLRRIVVIPHRQIGLHILRSVAGYFGFMLFLYTLTRLPLADAVAINFAVPLCIVVFAALFLRERVRWRRWTATVVGFLGVLIMMRPGQHGVDPIYLLALGACVLSATAAAILKKLTAGEHPITLIAVFAAFNLVFGLPFVVWFWAPLYGVEWLWLLGLATVNALGQFLFITAYSKGEASAIAPIDYTRIVFTTVLGIVFFAEIPDLWTVAGAAIIAGSALYITFRETEIARREAS